MKNKNWEQALQVGMVYYLEDYTAPKVYNGLYFECLVTDQKIPANKKVVECTGKLITEWEHEIYKPERFKPKGWLLSNLPEKCPFCCKCDEKCDACLEDGYECKAIYRNEVCPHCKSNLPDVFYVPVEIKDGCEMPPVSDERILVLSGRGYPYSWRRAGNNDSEFKESLEIYGITHWLKKVSLLDIKQ